MIFYRLFKLFSLVTFWILFKPSALVNLIWWYFVYDLRDRVIKIFSKHLFQLLSHVIKNTTILTTCVIDKWQIISLNLILII